MFSFRPTPVMVTPNDALPGSPDPRFNVPEEHVVLGTNMFGPYPDGIETIYLALGCFWGEEKALWQLPGVYTTAVGYMGGYTPNPTYEEVCTGQTGHTETVLVAYDPQQLSTAELLSTFWQLHDPTQGYRQGNDVGTQYRSAIFYTTPEQQHLAVQTREIFAEQLRSAGYGDITTQIAPAADAGPFYPAEEYHQQYLVKNPNGYCPVHSTGVACPLPSGN